MKRSHVLALSCACALVLALFGLSACGSETSSSSSTSSKTTSSTASSSSSIDSDTADAQNMSEEEIRGVFDQVVATMSEFYQGTTPAGEELYYAGGADGANAIFALVVPEANQSAIFVGPATVGEDDNTLTITDETTGSAISFKVTSNEDGTISFSMGDEYGYAVMTKCKSSVIVDKLVELIANAPTGEQSESAAAQQTEQDQQATQDQ